LMGDPPKRLWISAFRIAVTPVTHRQYAEFIVATRHPAPEYWLDRSFPRERGDHPGVGVTLDDARAYARWKGLAFPTEEGWEEAARGMDGRTLPCGGRLFSGRAGARGRVGKDTRRCGGLPAGKSRYGCLDRSGNVWEWTESPHDASGRFIALKGGSWYDIASYARCAARFSARPDYRGSCVGFRCVKR